MKNMKTLSIFPIFLILILSGCGGGSSRRSGSSSISSQGSGTQSASTNSDSLVEMDEQQARQRLERYNPDQAVAPYSSVEVTTDYTIIRTTGDYAEGGYLASVTEAVERSLESQKATRTEGGENLKSFVFGTDDLDMYFTMADTECKFYEYLTTGMIVEINIVQREDNGGANTTITTHMMMYLFDDGRMEKSVANALMSTDGSTGGVNVQGELEYGGVASLKWIRQ